LQPNKQFLSGLNAADISRIQRDLLEVICSGQPGSDDPETVPAEATEEREPRVDDNASGQLLKQPASCPGEALALAMHNIQRERLSPKEKRRHRARKATYYRPRQIQWSPETLKPEETVIRCVDGQAGRRTPNCVAPGRNGAVQQRSEGAAQPDQAAQLRAGRAQEKSTLRPKSTSVRGRLNQGEVIMDYKSEAAIECVEYVPHEDGTGGTAIIEVPTIPLGLPLRINGVQLLRIPAARPWPDEVVPLWSVHFPAGITLQQADKNKFRTAVMAAVVRYQTAIDAGGSPPRELEPRGGRSATGSGWPKPLATMIQ
jgi:hypothetical protein